MTPFELPPYPYDLLDRFRELAGNHQGGVIDLSVGTPCDPPPAAVVEALSKSGSERGYPKSIGSTDYLEACSEWLQRRFGVEIPVDEALAGCIGTKELVASTPSDLRLANPEKDTVLFPSISYPSYAMGAQLAGCRAVPIPVDSDLKINLEQVSDDDANRALMIWINSPCNPTGVLEDLTAVAKWGRDRNIPVFSDECYTEFTWKGEPQTILNEGLKGVVAVHSLSKRSNLAGLRAGFFAGDPAIVHWLREIRKHGGKMIPGPVQSAAVHAFRDDGHVADQRALYKERLEFLKLCFRELGFSVSLPEGTFYLWIHSQERDCWEVVESLAAEVGVLVTPGTFFGKSCENFIRVAAVQEMSKLTLLKERISKLS
ncbi:MAG: aminotransferase class I/II-fold pyridoxal phosphate-dependent enzyme [Acidimicrobiales bacterium]|jgi:succinyldiaminopimelate transaminase|nr:aminotransferase class I/II-fold pyridoxal phosphate-dependent enzyme [Acidimicrobiales bacterium]MDP6298523.1 aminotransferase class I/II-fold pyridoxal phosphate-dependent enzyme [Acidimicrobiales bacterium]HJM27593.1 aminotransferase class I/II-fold pyridoxal phosphate-dependent enzyme [Acidimicrobiales bacterium]HJM98253.1 aminotransferase class I/II-fold pyridoxal phosphate-dependent enzyme [Acidimicrobiales bacterium]